MQIKLKIALAVAGFALATVPAFAAEMPADGSKNFSTPADAPSYFTNEAIPEPARVDHAAAFDKEDAGISPAAPDVGPAVSVATEPERHGKHASGHKSTRHASGKSKGHGGSARYAKSTSSKTTAALHRTAKSTTTGSRSASAAKAGGKSGTSAGASKTGPTKHAKTGTGQHADAIPTGASPLAPV
jgi:hypothetical protein